jgi:putative methyltransferase (TIGR04325 family)
MSDPIPLSVRARLVAKGLTPPYLWSALKRAKDRRRPAAVPPPPPPPEPESLPEWEYAPEGWARPAGGWDVEAVVRTYRRRWPSFLAATAGPGPLGVNHEVPAGTPVPRDDVDAQHIVLAYGYALALAAGGKATVSVLDWGGGPGHYAVLAEALLPGVELDYHSRDLSGLVALGRELLPRHSFHDDDACLARRYDLVLVSGSLQYSEDWRGTLAALAGATAGLLYVTRLPVALASPPFVVLQRVQPYGYETEYLGWVLNRDELVEHARAVGLELVRELILPVWLSAAGAPEAPTGQRGFLFRLSA